MSNERKLTRMVDYFRGKLAEEQLRHADTITSAQELEELIQEKDVKISQLESELEGYRVQSEDEDRNPESNNPF